SPLPPAVPRPGRHWSGPDGTAALDLAALGDGGDDLRHRVLDRYPVLLGPVAVPERDRLRAGVLTAGDQDVGHLLLAGVADLLLHPVVGRVHLDPDAALAEPGRDALQVVVVLGRDRDPDHLDRRQPGREG